MKTAKEHLTVSEKCIDPVVEVVADFVNNPRPQFL